MTSRARRIVLAMYGHREFTPVPQPVVADSSVYWMGTHGCYEAMDEPDEIPPARILIGGNYGLPCA